MSSADRRQRQKQALRDHLLATAWNLFAQRPADEVTVRVIAEAAEYSPRTLYLHFADRDDLLAAVVEEAYRQTAEALPPEDPAADPSAVLTAQVVRHVGRALDQPRLYEALCFELGKSGVIPGPFRRQVEDRQTRVLEALGWRPAEAALFPALLRSFTLALLRRGAGSSPEAEALARRFARRMAAPA